MSGILLKLILLLAPVAGFAYWLRWMARRTEDESEKAAEVRRMRLVLLGLMAVALGAGLGLYLSDDNSGDPRTTYVPSRVEDGKLVPGRFEDDDTGGSTDKPSDTADGDTGTADDDDGG